MATSLLFVFLVQIEPGIRIPQRIFIQFLPIILIYIECYYDSAIVALLQKSHLLIQLCLLIVALKGIFFCPATSVNIICSA